jgi:mono/diheme cytochrome c family protein
VLAGCPAAKPRDAATLYARACARCHGADGKGVPRMLAINPRLDLTTAPLVRSRDRAAIAERIAKGHGPMPGFSRQLSAEEIALLTSLSLTFAEKP